MRPINRLTQIPRRQRRTVFRFASLVKPEPLIGVLTDVALDDVREESGVLLHIPKLVSCPDQVYFLRERDAGHDSDKGPKESVD